MNMNQKLGPETIVVGRNGVLWNGLYYWDLNGELLTQIGKEVTVEAARGRHEMITVTLQDRRKITAIYPGTAKSHEELRARIQGIRAQITWLRRRK